MANGKENWIGFDLGGTKMLAVVFDHKFNQIGRSRKKTKGHEGMRAGLAKINDAIAEAIGDRHLRLDHGGLFRFGCGVLPRCGAAQAQASQQDRQPQARPCAA